MHQDNFDLWVLCDGILGYFWAKIAHIFELKKSLFLYINVSLFIGNKLPIDAIPGVLGGVGSCPRDFFISGYSVVVCESILG